MPDSIELTFRKIYLGFENKNPCGAQENEFPVQGQHKSRLVSHI